MFLVAMLSKIIRTALLGTVTMWFSYYLLEILLLGSWTVTACLLLLPLDTMYLR